MPNFDADAFTNKVATASGETVFNPQALSPDEADRKAQLEAKEASGETLSLDECLELDALEARASGRSTDDTNADNASVAVGSEEAGIAALAAALFGGSINELSDRDNDDDIFGDEDEEDGDCGDDADIEEALEEIEKELEQEEGENA